MYDKAARPEQAFLMLDLTFPYISFAKNFCQKKVKKNCKYVARVFFENTDMRRKKRHGKLANVLRGWFIGRGDADLSLRDKMRCDGQRLTLQMCDMSFTAA